MSEQPTQHPHFASLFEDITGQSTLTEHQQTDITVRIADGRTEGDIEQYVDSAATADGFDDVIDDPETY